MAAMVTGLSDAPMKSTMIFRRPPGRAAGTAGRVAVGEGSPAPHGDIVMARPPPVLNGSAGSVTSPGIRLSSEPKRTGPEGTGSIAASSVEYRLAGGGGGGRDMGSGAHGNIHNIH